MELSKQMLASKFSAIGNRLLLKPDVAEEKELAGGLILPTAAQEKPLTGTLVKVGPDVKDPSLSEGAKVVYSKYGGMVISFDEGPHLLLREDDVMGVMG